MFSMLSHLNMTISRYTTCNVLYKHLLEQTEHMDRVEVVAVAHLLKLTTY